MELETGDEEEKEEEEIGNGTGERDRKKELRRRGLFNSNLPTLSVCRVSARRRPLSETHDCGREERFSDNGSEEEKVCERGWKDGAALPPRNGVRVLTLLRHISVTLFCCQLHVACILVASPGLSCHYCLGVSSWVRLPFASACIIVHGDTSRCFQPPVDM